MNRLWVLISLYLFLCVMPVRAQESVKGTVSGFVFDKSTNKVLPNTSVSLYVKVDSSVLTYQLSSGVGSFQLRNVPFATPMYIVISHMGYGLFRKEFSVSSDDIHLKLGDIYLDPKAVALEEVVVDAPPVRMNGDTLEFNASAFKLDKNAIVEDLLRKLPGITLWGDGKITVNGREVKKLLVEGKDFFGGENRTATQNLPKHIVDKIQVYSDKRSAVNPQDTVLNMNIRLRKGMNYGLFGKAGGGYGTDNRYLADGVVNAFNTKTQISIGGASNNTNVTASDMSSLISNASFKGVGASLEYQPDFETSGLYDQHMVGAKVLHDFRFASDWDYDRLGSELYIRQKSGFQSGNTLRETNLEQGRILENSKYDDDSDEVRREGKLSYRTVSAKQEIDTEIGFQNREMTGVREGTVQVTDQNQQVLSLQKESTRETEDLKNLDIKLYLRKRFYNIRYNGYLKDKTAQRQFMSAQDMAGSSASGLGEYDRSYERKMNDQEHRIDANIYLDDLLFPEHNFSKKFVVLFGNQLFLKNADGYVKVYDFNRLDSSLTDHSDLTNRYRDLRFDYRPSLGLSRIYTFESANRYRRTLIINADLRGQYFNQNTTSDKSFQRYGVNTLHFIPTAAITYVDRQYGHSETKVLAKYDSWYNYASFDQRGILLDSATLYVLRKGNPDLDPSHTRELYLSYSYSSQHNHNLIDNANIGIKASQIGNAFSDSITYDAFGRSIYETVNIREGGKMLTVDADIRKAYKLGENQFQIGLKSNYMLSAIPRIINGVQEPASSQYLMANLSLHYSYKKWLLLQVIQRLSKYSSRFATNHFSSISHRTDLSMSTIFMKRLTVGNNVSYNTNSFRIGDNHYFLWNASISLRFMKANQGEIKLSILDILRQNKNVVNYSDAYGITTGYTNGLRQYGMLSLFYYPRKFAKNK